MSRSNIGPKFPEEIWDGLTPTTDSLLTEISPDLDFGARFSAEIRALEEWLFLYKGILEYIAAFGPANATLGVKGDGLELEWKEFVEGANVTITHGLGTITIAAAGGGSGTDFINEAKVDIDATQPVYYDAGTTGVRLAKADAAGTSRSVGVAIESKLATLAIKYRAENVVTAADWTASTGAAALSPNAIYYLSTTTAGMMTTTPPSTVGQYVVKIGRAASTTVLDLDIRDPILL